MSPFERSAMMSADAQVISMDFPFSARSVLPEEVTMRIPATAVITRHPSVRRLRIVFAAVHPSAFAFFSVSPTLPSPDVSNPFAVSPFPRYSPGLKVKPVDMRLSSASGTAYILFGFTRLLVKKIPAIISAIQKKRNPVEGSRIVRRS